MHTHLIDNGSDPDATRRVLVSVHGTGGNGETQLAGLRDSAEATLTGNWLIVCPTFATPYQYLLPDADAALLRAIDALHETIPSLDSRLHLYGFSGGAQFTHRFTLKHPDQVAACVAFAAGCWTDADGTAHGMQIDEGWFVREGWDDPAILVSAQTGTGDPEAFRNVPFMVGCGTKDHASRQRSAKDFHERLIAAGVASTWVDWDGGHEGHPGAVEQQWLRFVDARL